MSPISENERTAMIASDGSDTRRYNERKLKLAIKHELDTIEQLTQRIAMQCAAERRLGEVVPARVYDPDRLRVIRLALNSAGEALSRIERVAYQIDTQELKGPDQRIRIHFEETCEPTMDGIDQWASDLQFIANSEAYMIGLIASRRRLDPAAFAFMAHSIASMHKAVSDMEGAR